MTRDGRRIGPSDGAPPRAAGRRPWRCSSSARRRRRRSACPQDADAARGQRHLAVVHRLEPPGTRHLRHRRLPLADRTRRTRSRSPTRRTLRPRQGRPRPVEHYYSSKPPLLPTLIAGILYPFRAGHGRPARLVVNQERLERNVEKEGKPGAPSSSGDAQGTGTSGRLRLLLQADRHPAEHRPASLSCLILYARLLDRYADERLGLVPQPLRGGLGDVPARLRPDAEQPHASPPTALLRPLCPAADLDRAAAGAGVVRGGRVLRGLLRLQRDSRRRCSASCCSCPAPDPDPEADRSSTSSRRRSLPCCGVPGDAIPRDRASSSRSTRSSGPKAYNYEGSYWNTPLEFD